MSELEHVHDAGDVAEAVFTEIEERHSGRQVAAHQRRGALGHHDLAAVRGAHQARTSIQRLIEVLPVAQLANACEQTHADPQRTGSRRPRPDRGFAMRVEERRRSRTPRPEASAGTNPSPIVDTTKPARCSAASPTIGVTCTANVVSLPKVPAPNAEWSLRCR